MDRKKTPPSNASDAAERWDRCADSLDACLFDLAFEPIIIRRFDGEIIFWNKGAEDLYGYNKEEALGRSIHELLKTVFPVPKQEFEDQLAREGIWIGELFHNLRNGQKVIVESRHQLFDKSDGGSLVLETNRDITTRENQYRTLYEDLQEGEQGLRLALDSAQMGMWDWDISTDKVWWDDRQYQLFGVKPEEFSGYAAQAIEKIHPNDREKVKAEIDRTVNEGVPFETEFRIIHPDGLEHWLAGRGRLINSVAGSPERMVGVNYDITDRKKIEFERDKYTRLENIAQMHRLQIAGEFAALLAHQLNQPLTAIRSFAEAGIAHLRRGSIDPLLMREILEDVVAQSERAASSIRDLRKFLARQPQEMKRSDINAEVNAACSLMDVLARGRNVRIQTSLGNDLPMVSMRPSQIEQIIINLIENAMDAINHTDHGEGQIEISTRLDPGKNEIVIDIRDSGPGLDEKTVGLVFDPLYTTKKNGIGMGLAISRSIISDHRGRIWAEPGPGGHFVFTLPLTK